jgi:hypothetical protein
VPENNAFKKKVRARMAQTGEKYTTARRHLMDQRPTAATPTRSPGTQLSDDVQTVLGRFTDALLIKLPSDQAHPTARAAAAFEATGRSGTQQCAQFYALLNRAYRVWCAEAVRATGRDVMHEGLLSVGQIFDAASASYNGAMLAEYRLSIQRSPASKHVTDDNKEAADQADRDASKVMLAVHKATRIAAGYDDHSSYDIPQRELLQGAEWCATALAAATEGEIVLDIAEEASQTARALARV